MKRYLMIFVTLTSLVLSHLEALHRDYVSEYYAGNNQKAAIHSVSIMAASIGLFHLA